MKYIDYLKRKEKIKNMHNAESKSEVYNICHIILIINAQSFTFLSKGN